MTAPNAQNITLPARVRHRPGSGCNRCTDGSEQQGMTLVIPIFAYPAAWWSVHILWVAMALHIITRGPGALSLDHLLWRRMSAAA